MNTQGFRLFPEQASDLAGRVEKYVAWLKSGL